MCKVVRLGLVERRKEYTCRSCNHRAGTPTRAVIALEFAFAVVVLPLIVHFHPAYSWSAVGELPAGFWGIWAAIFAWAVYSTYALTKFEREAPLPS